MVCIRCIMLVKEELKKMNLHYSVVELGEIEVMEDITYDQHEQLKEELKKIGLELLDDKKAVLIQRIKSIIVQIVHHAEEPLLVKFSNYLSKQLSLNYTYLSNLFSELQGITIEQFIIAHKIERVKELLVYDELKLTEIAYLMHYSSVSHLSNQFKKKTGLTPSHFKELRYKRRSMLENL